MVPCGAPGLESSTSERSGWIATTFGGQMGYHAVHTLVHDKLRARPNVARPSPEKTIRTP